MLQGAYNILARISRRRKTRCVSYIRPKMNWLCIAKDFATSCNTKLVVGPHAAGSAELFKV